MIHDFNICAQKVMQLYIVDFAVTQLAMTSPGRRTSTGRLGTREKTSRTKRWRRLYRTALIMKKVSW